MDNGILTISISLRHVKLNFNAYFSIEVGLPNLSLCLLFFIKFIFFHQMIALQKL